MSTHSLRRTVLAVAFTATAGSALWVPGIALASCAPLPAIEQAIADAPAVFTGTVVALEGDDRLARVAVDEVWKGDVGATAVVRGAEQIEPGMFTSVDRTYEKGARYLFVPRRMAGEQFADDGCTLTQLYTADLEAFRPADARVIAPPPGDGFDGLLVAAGILAAAATAAAGLVAARKRRTPQAA